MQLGWRLSTCCVALAALALGVNSASAYSPPSPPYLWAQPGAAHLIVPDVQPPAWIPIAAAEASMPALGSSYAWAQPGTAHVAATDAQPPASIPAG